ncbi:hypothetical protein [Prevotella jejuni]|nr:hypothetical protein [Prevotella jejuni]
MQTTSRYASRTSASLGEGHSFIALRFGTCTANRSKKYVTPCISIIAVETATLLAGSGPEASIEDINYGGDLTNEIDDQ